MTFLKFRCDNEYIFGHVACVVIFLLLDVIGGNSWIGFMNESALLSFNNYSINFSFPLLLKVHIMASSLNLLVYLCFGRKQDAEYASGVSRPCYSCNTRYMHWIYSMHTVFSDPWTWLYTCVTMHMLNLPRAGLNVAQCMCDTQSVFSHVAVFIKC